MEFRSFIYKLIGTYIINLNTTNVYTFCDIKLGQIHLSGLLASLLCPIKSKDSFKNFSEELIR